MDGFARVATLGIVNYLTKAYFDQIQRMSHKKTPTRWVAAFFAPLNAIVACDLSKSGHISVC
ncbi:hypothetical protein BLOT_007772 [Blomia tropicalis]|nr:hypothetical protein BLOT_007772 [Blomia tropicalis]